MAGVCVIVWTELHSTQSRYDLVPKSLTLCNSLHPEYKKKELSNCVVWSQGQTPPLQGHRSLNKGAKSCCPCGLHQYLIDSSEDYNLLNHQRTIPPESPSLTLRWWRSSLRFVTVSTVIKKNKNISLRKSVLHSFVASGSTFLALFWSCIVTHAFSLSPPSFPIFFSPQPEQQC